MKRPNISSGNWQAKLHRDMTPPRTKVETRDAVICDTLGNEADAIACAAVPDLLEALELARDLIAVARSRFPKSVKHRDTYKLCLADAVIGSALAKAGYTF